MENENLREEKLLNPSEIANIRILGGLGALFALAGIIPYIGWLLSVASIVLLLISFYKISFLSGKKFIFNYILISVLLGFAMAMVVVLIIIFSFMEALKFSHFDMQHFIDTFRVEGSILYTILMILVFIYALSIVVAFLWKRSLEGCALFFKEKLFSTAGLLFVIGAFTLILCGIGILVSLAGYIVLAIAFFSIKPIIPEQEKSADIMDVPASD